MMTGRSEEWRPVKTEGYEGLYEVSSFGRVRSMARVIKASNRVLNYKTRILKQNIDSGGYSQVTLCRETKRKTIGVHVLVAEAFIGPRVGRVDICHDDGIQVHNHPHNLRYGTRSENTIDKFGHGTHNWQKGFIPRDMETLRERNKEMSEGFMDGKCDFFSGGGSSYIMGKAEETTDDDWS